MNGKVNMKRLFVIILIYFSINTSDVCAISGYSPKVDFVAILNELEKKGRDESLNSEPFYRKAAELSVKLPEEMERDDLRKWPSELTDRKKSILRRWVKSNINAFNQLKPGTQKPYYWNQYQGDNLYVNLPSYLPQVRDIVHATFFRVKLRAIETGLTKEIIEDLLICSRFGSHLTQSQNILIQLVGLKIIDNITDTVFICLAKKDFSLTEMEMLQSSLNEQFSKNQKQTFNLDLEKLRHFEAVQLLFQDTRKFSKLKPGEKLGFAARQSDLTYEYLESLSVGRTENDIENAFVYYKEFFAMSPWQAREKGLNFWEDIDKEANKNPVVRLCTFNAPAIARVRVQYDANMDALLTTLAIIRYKDEKDRFPSDLQELLSANYLSKLPMDPYSDEPLVYRQTGNNFMLYSLGQDFDDDGGLHSDWGWGERGGDYVFWPVQTESNERKD
jgi:hypothetical protein